MTANEQDAVAGAAQIRYPNVKVNTTLEVNPLAATKPHLS